MSLILNHLKGMLLNYILHTRNQIYKSKIKLINRQHKMNSVII